MRVIKAGTGRGNTAVYGAPVPLHTTTPFARQTTKTKALTAR
ncbi:MAG: hypothetical protein M5U34_18205 [Chloroflexi bacterium]|nr:hypothetical protein [Chloroflexota bacterium]